MSLLDTYRINKAITVLLTSQDAVSAEALQAVATLKRLGPSTIPRLIAALGQVQNPRTMVELLVSLVQNATLPLFGDGLASTNSRVVAGVVEVLTQATTYDPNRLLDFFPNPRIARGTLGKLLTVRKEALQPDLLIHCLDTVGPEDRAFLLELVRQVATVATVPALIRHIASADETVRLAMVRTLARFHTEAVREALLGVLADPHERIREAALAGLTGLQLPLPMGPICHLLRDPEQAVRRQASILLAQRKDPQAVSYLFDVLQDPAPEVQQGAVELLAVIGDATTVKAAVTTRADTAAVRDVLIRLLDVPQRRVRQFALEGLTSLPLPFDINVLSRLLWDPDRVIRQQATALLTPRHAPQMLPVLIEALQAEAADVRQVAVTILNAIGNVELLKELLRALREQEWWVTMRATDALGRGGEVKVIEAALQLSLDTDPGLRRAAIETLKLTQAPQVPDFLVTVLESQDPWARTCAAEAAAALGEKRTVPVLLRLAQTGDADASLVALRTLTTLGDTRAIPVCLAHLQQGTPRLRQEALQALATLTDTAHARVVMQAVMAVRSSNDANLKELANRTANTLIQRLGAQAVEGSTSPSGSMSRRGPQSLLHASTPESNLQATVASPPDSGSDAPQRPAAGNGFEMMGMSPPVLGRSVSAPASGAPVSEPMLDAAALEPGTVWAERYRILRRIGQGGFGTVVLAEDLMIHEQLILKFLNPQMAADAQMIQRFIHELRYARRVTHENVIRIHDFLHAENAYAISMEYFPSQSLSDDISRHAPMPIQRGLRIIWSICRGLHAAHQAQIIHRDLKPANVLINDAGMVKIVDFGLAAAVSDMTTRLTRTGALLGTPMYMAPEQVQNRTIEARTDIYSLGVMMYEIFTGRTPYLGDNPMAILYQHLEGRATPPRELNAHLPLALEAVIQKTMAVDPEQRFQSVEELGKSLMPLFKQSTP